jgi:hypothetical protein
MIYELELGLNNEVVLKTVSNFSYLFQNSKTE